MPKLIYHSFTDRIYGLSGDPGESISTEEWMQSVEDRLQSVIRLRQQPDDTNAVWTGDAAHPDWTDYLATNLLDALQQVPDTGDWHGALRMWCELHKTGKLKPNRQP